MIIISFKNKNIHKYKMDILHFGKFCGSRVREVPFYYLLFLAGYGLSHGKRFPLQSDNHAFNYVLENHPFIVDIAKEYLSNNYKTKKKKLKYCKSCGRKLVPINDDWA